MNKKLMKSSGPLDYHLRASLKRGTILSDRSWRFSWAVGIILAVIILLGSTIPRYVASQTLDSAVNQQLGIDPITLNACGVLLGNDLTSVLVGALRNICDRTIPQAVGANSAATGGGAATATGLPNIVQERLRSEKKKPDTGAGKPDVVVELEGGLGLFFSGQFERLNRDITRFEDGYNSDIWRVTTGADYQFTKSLVGGLAFDAYNQHGSFDGGGRFNTNSYGFLAFASLLPFDRTFLQLSAGYARKLNDRDRIATFNEQYTDGSPPFSRSGSATTDYNADETRVSALAGFDFPIGNITIGPRAGLDVRHVDFGTYRETSTTGLALTFHDVKQTSLQTVIGLQSSVALSTGFGVIVPQASLNWKHEFQDDQRKDKVSFVDDTRAKRFTYQTERPDRNFFEINAGASAVLPHGVQPFVNYRTLVGHSFFKSHAGTIGLRVTF